MSNVFEGTRFCIHTFGCQMNKHDSERVAGMLEGLGSLPVETIEEADIVVFMTCCVREAADTRLYGQVASMKNIPLRDGTPLDKRYIAVGGCIGQRDGDIVRSVDFQKPFHINKISRMSGSRKAPAEAGVRGGSDL